VIAAVFAFLLWSSTNANAAPRSEELLWSGRATEALSAVREELATRPRDIAAHERHIDLLIHLGQTELAVATYRRNLEKHPDDPDAHYLIGRTLADPELASKAYLNGLTLSPTHARSHMGMGAVYRATGKLTQAETAYDKAVRLDPTLTEAWLGLWQSQDAAGRRVDAIATARSAIKAIPAASEPYLALSIFVPEEAASTLLQGQKALPKDPRFPAALAELQLSKGDGKAAERAIRQALVLAPEDKSFQRALMYAKALVDGYLDPTGVRKLREQEQLLAEDPRTAELRYAGLIEAYPKSVLPRLGRAHAFIKQGQQKDAVTDLIEARKISETDIDVQATLGLLLLEIGQTADAKPLLAAAVAARPEDPSLVIGNAQALAKTGNKADARKQLAAAYKKWPLDARVALAFAQVVSDSGDREEAYFILKEASTRLPDGRVVIALVAAATDTGRFTEAADLLDSLYIQTQNDTFKDLATKLRAKAP